MNISATAYIVYWIGKDECRVKVVACHKTKDNQRTLKKHLKQTLPEARFVGAIIKKGE